MKNNNVRCMYCGKELGGFIFEHNCEKKSNSKGMWEAKRIGRYHSKKRSKLQKMWI